MRQLIIYFILLFSFAFNKNDNENDVSLYWEKAKTAYSNQYYEDTLIILNNIVDNYPDSNIIPECLYLIHEIYQNQFEKYYISIQYLENIITDYPEHNYAKKALFTLAYLYSNQLEMYTDAYNMYNQFIAKYPNDDLVDAAKYEIENLLTHINIINDLIKDN